MAAKTSFQVTSFLLEDLSLLNSELGRLVLSSALISSIGCRIFGTYNAYYAWSKMLHFRTLDYFRTEIPRAISILAIIFVLRPFMFWLMRRIPEGRPIKESHFFVMTVMFLTVSFAYEFLGYSAPLGAMILGLCVPPGRPLGSGVVEKLETFISAVLLPTYIVDVGRYVDIFQISMAHYIQAEIIILLSFSAKLAAGVIPSVIWRMPYKDSFALGLLLSAQGFFDILYFKLFYRYGVMLYYVFLIMLSNSLIISLSQSQSQSLPSGACLFMAMAQQQLCY
ncbi:hypothetical protein C3L33_14869, partial [Rhododendron williamsianum]